MSNQPLLVYDKDGADTAQPSINNYDDLPQVQIVYDKNQDPLMNQNTQLSSSKKQGGLENSKQVKVVFITPNEKSSPEKNKQAIAKMIQQNSAPSYKTPQDFLDQVTLTVDTSGQIYQHIDSYLYPTSSVDDEYVIIVLKIMDENLKKFYGGSFIVQQWVKKRKLFQTVHKAKPNRFFLYKQRYVYSLQGTTEECQWLYIVNFFQEVFNKIRHPLYNPNSVDGSHEIQLFADNKMMLVASHDKIMWAPFKFEENKDANKEGDDSANPVNQDFSRELDQTQV